MNRFAFVLLGLASVALGLRWVTHRMATHQAVLPNIGKRMNTQVHRINQSR